MGAVGTGGDLETAIDAIITLDGSGRIVELNPAAERMFGLVRDQVVGRDMADLIIPQARRAPHRAGLARLVATGQGSILGRRLEMRALRSDGTEFPCELVIAAAQLPSGPIFTGFVRDLSERKAAEGRQAALEEQLRQSQKMQAIGDSSGSPPRSARAPRFGSTGRPPARRRSPGPSKTPRHPPGAPRRSSWPRTPMPFGP